MSVFLPKPGSTLLVALLVAAGACQPEAERDDTAGHAAFTFHQIRDGIWHAVGTGNLAVGSNAAVVINEDHVLLVDSHVSPAAAGALLEELRSITSLPVRYVVNTHFHFDHAHGNQVYPDEVEIIGHEFTREMIASGESIDGRTYRTDIGMLPERIGSVAAELEAATDPDERVRLERRLRILEDYKAATDAVEPTPPTVTLRRRLTIHRDEREIRVLFFGRGHTGGDVVVHLPDDGVLITGDLLNSQLPYMGDAYLSDWVETLEHLKELEFDIILPGHGEAFQDREKIDHLQIYLRDLQAQIVDLYRDGVSAESAARQVDMQAHADHYPFIDGPGVPPRTVERVYDLLDQREERRQQAAPLAQEVEVWSGEEPDFLTGDISPDGRYFSDIDWETGDLRIVDLQTGEGRALTGEGYSAGRYAWTSAFSTDGRRLAVSWYVYEVGSHELRITDLDGSGSRILVPADPRVTYVEPLDWSPSDERILVAVRGADFVWQLGLVSVDDGSVQILKTLDWLAPGGEQTYPRAWFSPDGKYIAYDYRPELDERARSIYALAVDGSGEAELVAGRAVHRLLGWLPDGRGILFSTSRGETSEVWQLPVRDGVSGGDPFLLHPGLQALSPLGFTPAGYAYGAPDESRQLHTATLDPHTGQIIEAPRAVGDPPSHTSLAGDWSPDGSRLAYAVHTPQPNAVEALMVRTVAGDVVRTIPLDPTIHTSSATFRWIADDLIVLFAMEKGRNRILRMDPRDGGFTRIPGRVTDGAGNLKFFGVGPEARELYFALPPSGNDGMRKIVARNAETGEQRAIATARADPRTLAVSPSGDEVAYVARNDAGRSELRTTATSGAGETRTLYRAAGRGLISPVAWAPDGSHILFVVAQPNEGRALWSIALDGQDEPVRLEGSSWCCEAQDIRIHPTGRRIAAVAGRDRGSIWLLEGF